MIDVFNWIGIKEKLPQGNNIKVLTTEKYYNVKTVKIRRYFSDNENGMMDSYEWCGAGFYDYGYETWFPVNTDNNVIAWAYMPKPYEGE